MADFRLLFKPMSTVSLADFRILFKPISTVILVDFRLLFKPISTVSLAAQFLQLVVAVDCAALAVHILRQFADLLLRLRQLRSQTFHRRRLFGRQVLREDRQRKTSSSG